MATSSLPKVRASELVGRGWLNTGGHPLSLAELRGKVVVLDFWTFCCVNCLHVLDELRELEARFADVLVMVGVHSPKFVHEADPDALVSAVERYEVHHPVLDDPTLITWQAYAARAWPTLVVIDPEGYVVAHLAGEGHGPSLAALVEQLVDEHEAKGTLRRGDGPYVAPEPTPGTLRFPAKAIRLPNGNLLVADSGHHSLAELAPDGETLVRRVGSGERGVGSGSGLPDTAQFAEPNGLCLVPPELGLDYDVVIADTANHLLRGVRLSDGMVQTLAGTGDQYVVGGPDNEIRSNRKRPQAHAPETGAVWVPVPFQPGVPAEDVLPQSRRIRLSSPWDVVWYEPWAAFVVAMAGNHTLWAFDPKEGSMERVAGTMNEGLVDGPAAEAWFAQPSGLAVDDEGSLWVADSETSALRLVTGPLGAARVDTVVGAGLFDFGHRDGAADEARLQHPLGVAIDHDGTVLVADTYNGAVRRWTPQRGTSGSPGGPDVPRSAHAEGTVASAAPDELVDVSAPATSTNSAAAIGEPGAVVCRSAADERVDFHAPGDWMSTRSGAGVGAATGDGVATVAEGLAQPAGPGEGDGRVTAGGSVSTVAEGLAEPSGLVVTADGVLVVESAAHRITRLASSGTAAVDHGTHRTQRPVTELAPGDLELVVPFTPAPGHKVDGRYGPSTQLSVSSSPPELLLDGAGHDTPLTRRLRLNPDIAEGVLHVSARAASCDADPAVEYPACHLAQQDWGVPIRITPGAPSSLTLPLLGS